MDAATLAAKLARAGAISARQLGAPALIYRPQSAGAAIAPGNIVGQTNLAVAAEAARSYGRPNLPKQPYWYALLDTSVVNAGDYLVRDDVAFGAEDGGTWFVAALQLHLPPLLVACNSTVTVSRPGGAVSGAAYYGGDVTATPILTSWPASVLPGTKGERGDTNLPGDTRMGWKAIILPPNVPAQIRSSDIITDSAAQPMRYTVSCADDTGSGWLISAALTVA